MRRREEENGEKRGLKCLYHEDGKRTDLRGGGGIWDVLRKIGALGVSEKKKAGEKFKSKPLMRVS